MRMSDWSSDVCSSDLLRRACADDPVGAEHAHRQVGDMHRAAAPFAKPVPAAVDLLHHPLHVAALGDAMAVPAMGGDDVVIIGQMIADADGGCFLTTVQMSESGDFPGLDLFVEPFLEIGRAHV